MTKKRKERGGEGKEREKSFLFCLYDPAINIYVFMLNNNNNNNNIVFRQIKHIHIKHTYIITIYIKISYKYCKLDSLG